MLGDKWQYGASSVCRCLQCVRQQQWQTDGNFWQSQPFKHPPHSPILYLLLLPCALVINVFYSPHAALKTRAAYCFSYPATGPQNDTAK